MQQERIAQITLRITCAIGMLGNIAIMCLFLSTKKRRRTIRHQLLFVLALCVMVRDTAFFMGDWTFKSHRLCALQGFLIQFASGHALLVATLMTHMILTIVFGWKPSILTYFVPCACVISIGYPIAVGLYFALNDMFAPSGPWCNISAEYPSHLFSMFLAVSWGCILYISVIAVIFLVRLHRRSKYLRSLQMPEIADSEKRTGFQILSFCAVFTLVFLPPTISRIYTKIHGTTNPAPFLISYLLVLITPLEGFFNFLFYVFPTIYRKYLRVGRLDRVVLNLDNMPPSLALPVTTSQNTFRRSSANKQGVVTMAQICTALEAMTTQTHAQGAQH